MKVRDCEKCPHCKRKRWSSYCKPKGYHAIGVSHTYRYCDLHHERCLSVPHCEIQKKGENYER